MRHAALFVAICLAFAPNAFSAESAKPVPASVLARSVNIPYESFTLDNGLRVVVHTDRKAPVVAVQAWYNVGSKDEPEGKTGYAHLFEHIGLFNPTENLPGGLMEPLRAIGATDWNGTTWFDRTNFFQTVPTSALEQALYMESDRMGHLLGALNQERLDNQRGVVQNEKRQGENQPYAVAYELMQKNTRPAGHPYSWVPIGSMEDLNAASLEDVKDWFRAFYGAACHGLCDRIADGTVRGDQAWIHAQHLGLGGVAVSDETALEPVAGAGHRSASSGNQAAGAAFGRRQIPAATAQRVGQRQHLGFDGVQVHSRLSK